MSLFLVKPKHSGSEISKLKHSYKLLQVEKSKSFSEPGDALEPMLISGFRSVKRMGVFNFPWTGH